MLKKKEKIFQHKAELPKKILKKRLVKKKDN